MKPERLKELLKDFHIRFEPGKSYYAIIVDS